jgi:hypothetical protein
MQRGGGGSGPARRQRPAEQHRRARSRGQLALCSLRHGLARADGERRRQGGTCQSDQQDGSEHEPVSIHPAQGERYL